MYVSSSVVEQLSRTWGSSNLARWMYAAIAFHFHYVGDYRDLPYISSECHLSHAVRMEVKLVINDVNKMLWKKNEIFCSTYMYIV